MVVDAAEDNKDWLQICDVLGVNRNTAESWIKAGRRVPLSKGGNRRKIITEDHMELFLGWLQEDPQITIKQIHEKAILDLNLNISTSTISRCLHGMCYTVKKVHHESINMNSAINKAKRKAYIERLQILMENGKNQGFLKLCIPINLTLNSR
jgi:transposase